MSNVAVVFKVYAQESDPSALMDTIKKDLNPAGMQMEEVAFGIKVIKVLFKFDDTKTSSTKFEEELKKVKGVGEIEVFEEGLI